MSTIETSSQLTKFLSTIFETIDDYSVDIESINQGQGDGYTTQMVYLTLSHDDSEKSIHLAIKQPKLNEDGTFSHYTDPHFENEIKFYKTIWPSLRKFYSEVANGELDFISTCYGVSRDAVKRIALENEKKNGYVTFDKMKSFDDEHIKKIFNTYAIFHGISMAMRIKNSGEYEKLTDGIEKRWETVLTDGKYIADVLKAIVSDSILYFNPVTEGAVVEKLEIISNIGPKLIREKLRDHGANEVILHGDCWSNNILFKYHVSI